jgi:hypothetical protein
LVEERLRQGDDAVFLLLGLLQSQIRFASVGINSATQNRFTRSGRFSQVPSMGGLPATISRPRIRLKLAALPRLSTSMKTAIVVPGKRKALVTLQRKAYIALLFLLAAPPLEFKVLKSRALNI